MPEAGFVRQLRRASRKLFSRLLSKVRCPSSRATSAYFPSISSSNPYSPYVPVPVLRPNSDASVGSIYANPVTQHGNTPVLRVMNPDPPSPSASTASLSSPTSLAYLGSSKSSVSSNSSLPPLKPLPSLFFVTQPQTPLVHAMSTYLHHSRSSMSLGSQVSYNTRDVSSPTEPQGIPRNSSLISSHSGRSTPPGCPTFSLHMKRQTSELFFTALRTSKSQRRARANDNLLPDPDRVEITGTSISSRRLPSFRVRTMDSLVELVEREGVEWSRGVYPQSSTVPFSSTPPLNWRPFVGIPLILRAGYFAQDRRLLRREFN